MSDPNDSEIPEISVEEAIGRCKCFSDDGLRYHFESSDDPEKWHTVDLSYYDCSGKCTCPDFEIRREPLLKSRTIKPHSDRAKCKHIRWADAMLNLNFKRRLLLLKNQGRTYENEDREG